MTNNRQFNLADLLENFPRTLREDRDIRARRLGRWTSITIYDPRHRDSEFVEDLLRNAGLDFDIEDEQNLPEELD